MARVGSELFDVDTVLADATSKRKQEEKYIEYVHRLHCWSVFFELFERQLSWLLLSFVKITNSNVLQLVQITTIFVYSQLILLKEQL